MPAHVSVQEAATTQQRQQEDQLALRVKSGDVGAFVELSTRYQRFVKSIARKEFSWRTHVVGLDDLLQLGQIGLWRACQKFRGCTEAVPSRGSGNAHFVTYAYRAIRTAMLRGIRHFGEAALDEKGAVKQLGVNHLRLDAPLALRASDRSPALRLLDLLPSPEPSPEEACNMREQEQDVVALLAAFSDELRAEGHAIALAVLHERLLAETPRELRALGARFSRSHERIRQIEQRTRERLRAFARARGWEFLDRDVDLPSGKTYIRR